MNPKKLLLTLIFIAVGIAALIWLNSLPSPDPAEIPKEENSLLDVQGNLAQSAINNEQATLLKGDFANLEHIVLHRAIDLRMCKLVPSDSDQWNLLEPIVDRAEAGLAGVLANHLFDTVVQPFPLEWMDRSHEELGLASPRLDLEVLYKNGIEEHIQVGAEVPGAPYHFALLDENLTLIPKQLVELINRPPELWRDHGIVRWPHLVRRLEWSPANGPGFILERNGNQWELLQPIQGAVDPMRMNSLLRMLGSRISSLPVDKLTEESLNLIKTDSGVLSLFNSTSKVGAPPQTFSIQGSYAVDHSRDYLLALAPGDFRFLDYTATELRSRRLENFDPNHIASVRLLLDSEEIVLQRNRTGWATNDGRRLSSEGQQNMTTMLRYLSILEAKELAKPADFLPVQSILLSKAQKPVQRGSTQFRYSIMSNGKTAISGFGSHQSYLADRNLDDEWKKVLVYEQ